MTKYVIDLPDNVSFIVGKGYVLFNEKEFLRIPVKQLEKYSKKEDVFEVGKPKKWVVRSKELSINGEYHYGVLAHFGDIAEMNYFVYDVDGATKFDTKEEAQSWANSHQEVIEVVDV
ncbi:hypothetical protein [uncultured Weissella sp.]|uniref:hypothetical protein n=1 Tax=uncultured Weissella sp. TaxID=253243 RepID=UPI00258F2218|nr:hypothetical protein [uncultured Weissella sp.]